MKFHLDLFRLHSLKSPLAMAEWIEIDQLWRRGFKYLVSASDGGVD